MNAPLAHGAPAHSPFGGSVATRVLRCPASVGLTQSVPAHLRKPSGYADRGTALHAAMVRLLDESPPSLESLVGETIGDYTITHEDVANALAPVYAYVATLLGTPGAEFYLEHRVRFPTIAGAFGTVDLLVRIGDTVHVVDFKFGSGVRVLALTPDGDADVFNGQVMFYAAAARYSLPEFFGGVRHVVLTIVQPRVEADAEMVSSVMVTHAELDEFVMVYRAACQQALSSAPHLERGTWCRFCPAKPICPAHTAPLLDLAQFAVLAPRNGAFAVFGAPPAKEAYLQPLADGLNLVDASRDIGAALRDQAKAALQSGNCVPGYALSAGRAALHDQAKAALENGDVVPGYTLTAGRAQRHWRDDERTTIAALEGIGLAHGDVVAEELRSPKLIEIRAKARGLKVQQEIQELVISRRSGTSLARCENERAPVRGRDELVRLFSAALETSRKEEIMTNDQDRNRDGETRREGQPVAPPPKGVALASTPLTALDAALSNVVRSATVGRSNKPILSFRSREQGIWTIGQRRTIVQEGSTAAVNLASLLHGYICFADDTQVLGEHLVPASQPKPAVTELPDHGFPWQEQLAVDMKFIDGADAGSEATYKPTTLGGLDVLLGVIDVALNRIRDGQHDGKTVPLVRFGRDSYQHAKYGRVWVPLLTIVGWMPPEGPAPASAPPPSPQTPAPAASAAEQPRHRRVA
jgi:hypothetical protein